MAESQGISGAGVAAIFAGGILIWSGVKGVAVSGVFRDLIAGKNPSQLPQATPVTPGGLFTGVLGSLIPGFGGGGSSSVQSTGGAVSSSNAANKRLGKRMAAAAGWTGSQWVAFNNIIMSESGWSATIKNPNSDASGIGQNIQGFGPGYEYGNAAQQIAWTIAYIKRRYKTPEAAWNFHLAHGWY